MVGALLPIGTMQACSYDVQAAAASVLQGQAGSCAPLFLPGFQPANLAGADCRVKAQRAFWEELTLDLRLALVQMDNGCYELSQDKTKVWL